MARKVDQRLSFCLVHQDRATDTRCSACLKPICEECTLTTELGKFCGNDCYEKRLKSDQRVQEMKEKDERDKGPRMMRMLLGWALKILFLVLLYFIFLNLPVAWKGWLTKSFKGLWKSVTAAFK